MREYLYFTIAVCIGIYILSRLIKCHVDNLN